MAAVRDARAAKTTETPADAWSASRWVRSLTLEQRILQRLSKEAICAAVEEEAGAKERQRRDAALLEGKKQEAAGALQQLIAKWKQETVQRG